MDGEGQTPDDLRVSLSWPGDENAPERVQREEPSGAEAASAVSQPPKLPVPVEEPVPAGQDEGAPEQPYLPEETVSGLRRRRPVESPRDSRPAPAHAPQPAASTPAPSMAAGLTSPDSSLSGRVDQLIVEMVATQARVDTLTDAMTTLRGLVSERMADLGQVLSHSQSQITQEMRETLAQAPGPAFRDVERTLEGAQERIARDVDKALARLQAQSARYLDEGLTEIQERIAQDIDAAVTRSQNHARSQLEEAAARWQAQSSRQADRLQQRYETTAATIESLATTQDRRADRLVAEVSAEVAAFGQRLTDQVSAAATAQRTELAGTVDRLGDNMETAMAASQEAARTGNERMVADIATLTETMADALSQVADRLERLAQSNTGQEDVVEAVADALDDVTGRVDDLEQAEHSRHDRLMALIGEVGTATDDRTVDLRPVTAALANIEVSVEALTQSTEDDRGVAGLVERVEALESSLADRFDRTTTEAVRALSSAVEQAAEQIKTASPRPVDLSSVTAMTRIEDRLSELTRQREENEQATRATVEGLEEMVARLASAQAEDLERILDSVENFTAPAETPVSLVGVDAQRLARIEAELGVLAQQRPPTLSAETESVVGEQLASLGTQLEALRRRLAVRARTPMLDDDAIDALADAVAARLEDHISARPAANARRPAVTSAKRPAKTLGPAVKAAGRTSRRLSPES